MLPKIKEYIFKLIEEGMPGYTLIADNVLVGDNVKIYDTATIEAPAIIGSNSEVRPGAFIRGSVITGKECVIGAGSVVTRDIPDGVFAAGNPCRVIRKITQEDSVYLKKELF